VSFLLYLLAVANPFSTVHSDVANTPFSFALPGYRNAVRVMILTDAVLTGIVFAVGAVLWASSEELVWPVTGGCAFTGFFLGVVFCFLHATPRLFPVVMAPGVNVLLSIPFAGAVGIALLSAVACPWLLWPMAVLACIAVSGFVMVRLSDVLDLAQAHRTIIKDAMSKRAQARVKNRIASRIGEPLLTWARRCRPLGFQRYVWAGVYRAMGPLLAYWKWAPVGVVVLSLILIEPVAEIAFASLGLLAILVDRPATSNLLLPGGRRERYWATVVVALATSLLFLGLATATAGLSELIALSLGPGAQSPEFRFSSVALAAALVPWVCTLKLCRVGAPKHDERLAPLFFGVTWLVVLRFLLRGGSDFAIVLGVAGLCGWGFFVLALRRICAGGYPMTANPRAGYAEGV